MTLQLVVFDMAGTTLYDDDFVNVAFRGALEAAGLAADREAVNAIMGWPKPAAVRHLIEQQHGSAAEADIERIHGDFVERMNAFYAEDPRVREVDGASATFRRLREAGLRVALNTGFSHSTVEVIMGRLGWADGGLVDATVASNEVAHGRPAPDMILRAMGLTGVHDPERVAKVGDTPVDLEEGTNARCRFVIGVTEGSHTREQLLPAPHTHLVPNVTHVPELVLASVEA